MDKQLIEYINGFLANNGSSLWKQFTVEYVKVEDNAVYIIIGTPAEVISLMMADEETLILAQQLRWNLRYEFNFNEVHLIFETPVTLKIRPPTKFDKLFRNPNAGDN